MRGEKEKVVFRAEGEFEEGELIKGVARGNYKKFININN